MDRESLSIAEEIRRIVGVTASPQIYMGKVVAGSQNEGEETCTVLLSIDDESVPTPGVLMTAKWGNGLGVVLVPADNSIVWVAEIDGPGKYGLVKTNELLKMLVQIGDVNMELSNGKVYLKQSAAELTMQSGKYQIKNSSTDLKTVLNGILTHIQALTVPTGTGPSGVPINAADFVADNTKVNQLLF